MLRKWEDLPANMRNEAVKYYYDILKKRKSSIIFKRIFDIIFSIVLIIILAIPMLVVAVLIKVDSKGPIIYRQERVTQYCKRFKIHKFRTMVYNADKIGTAVTVGRDSRITKVGAVLRKYRLDEIPQLIDVLSGDMSFVGTRPEAVKYVDKYTDEMMATLLMPAGITSQTSILYKDEAKILTNGIDVDETYVNNILPDKMKYNLESLRKFSLISDLKTIIKTVVAVLE